MASVNTARSKVLEVFKTLHRSRKFVFDGDKDALQYIRIKINEEFRKWQDVKDPAEIKKLLKIAEESNDILRNKVIQAKEIRPNVYRIRSDQLQANCTNARETCANCTCQ